jgi:tetratricopeptide (TPR) repeat protein
MLAPALALAVWGCATDMSLSSVERDLEAGRVDEAVREIEALAAREPNSYRVQQLRGVAHGEAALRRLFAKDEPAYLDHAEKAFAAYARASSFDPRKAAPHTGVALLLFYQGDMQGALEEFLVARMLEPVNPMHYANLAQMYVYMGRLSRARNMIEKGRKAGLHPVFAETVEMLASWRQGDMVDARDLFELASQDPEAMRAWLQEDPGAPPDFESFEELTAYCCNATTCGPHMGDACERMHHEVKQREVAAETLRRERSAALEREKARRETFGGRRDLEIEGEPEADEGGESPPQP